MVSEGDQMITAYRIILRPYLPWLELCPQDG